MSKTNEIKNQVIKINEKNKLQKLAKLSGIIRGAGSLVLSGNQMSLLITSDNSDVIDKTDFLLNSLYGMKCELNSETDNFNRVRYSIMIPFDLEKFKELNIYNEDDGFIYTINSDSQNNEEYLKSFLCGVFLSCGSIYLPTETRAGYTLEFSFNSDEMAESFKEKLIDLDFMPKKVARKGLFVVYLKYGANVCDFFAYIGAFNVVLEVSNIMAERETNNLINRQVNCEFANIDKAIIAGEKQVKAIKFIDENLGLDNLDPKLQALCKLRLASQESSLVDLAVELGGNITKSAINHRFRKIIAIAKELGGRFDD